MIYQVNWTEDISCWCHVKAESEEEAREKFMMGKEIPHSSDTEPGNGRKRRISIMESSEDAVHTRHT